MNDSEALCSASATLASAINNTAMSTEEAAKALSSLMARASAYACLPNCNYTFMPLEDDRCCTDIRDVRKSKRLRCEYCGIISAKDYGTCEHCGAPLVDYDYYELNVKLEELKAERNRLLQQFNQAKAIKELKKERGDAE